MRQTSRHAHLHAQTRTRERRQRLAIEAARLISESGIRDFHQAKLKAAQRLGIHDDQSLPRNSEIEEALREYQRLFLGDAQAQLLRERREAAAQAMAFLSTFEPRLVGAVLDGTADAHSAVCLHLHADDATAVVRFLDEAGIPWQEATRRLRLDRERQADFPVLVFCADGLPFDLTLLPHDALRQAPLDRGERPMRRASLGGLQRLIEESYATSTE
jgi:predicted component of type VI protein secretion system